MTFSYGVLTVVFFSTSWSWLCSPLLLDCTTENLADLVTLSLERLVGAGETDQFLSTIYNLVIQHSMVCRVYTQLAVVTGDSFKIYMLSARHNTFWCPVARSEMSNLSTSCKGTCFSCSCLLLGTYTS